MYKPLNGWTRDKMIRAIEVGMLDHRSMLPGQENGGSCAYRAADGGRCAVGLFIPDDVWHDQPRWRSINGDDVGTLLDEYPGLEAYMPLPLDALRDMQVVHDRAAGDPRPWLSAWVRANVTSY